MAQFLTSHIQNGLWLFAVSVVVAIVIAVVTIAVMRTRRAAILIGALVVAVSAGGAVGYLVGQQEGGGEAGAPRSPAPGPSEPATRSAPATSVDTNPRGLTIDSELNGRRVGLLADIRGQMNALQPGEEVWILVQPQDSERVFPQGSCNRLSTTSWKCVGAAFGEQADPEGLHFWVTAVVIRAADEPKYKGYYESGFPQTEPPVTPVSASKPIEVIRG